jgi:hypothetical protein
MKRLRHAIQYCFMGFEEGTFGLSQRAIYQAHYTVQVLAPYFQNLDATELQISVLKGKLGLHAQSVQFQLSLLFSLSDAVGRKHSIDRLVSQA